MGLARTRDDENNEGTKQFAPDCALKVKASCSLSRFQWGFNIGPPGARVEK